jgi:hypothetical protein
MSILYGPLLGAHGLSLCYGGGLSAPFSLAAGRAGMGDQRRPQVSRDTTVPRGSMTAERGRRDLRHAPVYLREVHRA